MTDAFALLGEPRSPVVDVDALKARFLELSASAHPDRFHGGSTTEKSGAQDRYTSINAAYQTLKDPRERLLHLLTLERGGPPRDIQRIPPGTMDLFVEVGQICLDCYEFLSRRSQVESPMLRLQVLRDGLGWLQRLQDLQRRVNSRRDDIGLRLGELDVAWRSAPPVGDPARAGALTLDRLEELYRIQSYIASWTDQIQERIVQLATPG